ncbi:MAG: metal ABC transporter ATP-binding protein [Deltaproteobacteria bacterium]|nr:MAG: metal ABC transporter ATP-binding protein [Deltaproteobacteria bacterium]
MNEVISLEDVSFGFEGKSDVLEDVTFSVERGEFLGIIGPNGGGKSTLLKLILGLLEPREGRITVLGTSPAAASRFLGYVPQFATFPRDFPISVEWTVLMGRLGRTSPWGGFGAEDRRMAFEALERLEVLHLRKKPIGDLSGGELQRVLIARALACEPEILLLDEPTASVDPHAEQSIFELLRQLNETVTILVVSHDIGFISRYIERVACVNHRLVCHRTEELTGSRIQAFYDDAIRMIPHRHSSLEGEVKVGRNA